MKKLLMAVLMIVAVSGVAMSQTTPHKKSANKEAHMKKSDSTATTSGTHKAWKKKSHSTKHN
jgi:hypothetical protein